MKCTLNKPCPHCPFLKEPTEKAQSLISENPEKEGKKALSDKGYACFDSRGSDELIQCAGAVIFTSLSGKIFKDKKLRFYQIKLGKNNEVFSQLEFAIFYKIKIS